MEQSINKSWKLFKHTKLGRWLFSRIIGLVIPYSGSVRPLIVEIEDGRSLLELRDRWFVRNHLKSVHAIALANIAELASGLAMFSKLPDNARGIVKSINIEYLKKAHGTLLVKGSANPPTELIENVEQLTVAEVFDASGELVSKIQVCWQIGPQARSDQ